MQNVSALFFHYPKQAVDQTVELSVIFCSMTLIWHYWNENFAIIKFLLFPRSADGNVDADILLEFAAGASANSTSTTVMGITDQLNEDGFMIMINGSEVRVSETITAVVEDDNGTAMEGEVLCIPWLPWIFLYYIFLDMIINGAPENIQGNLSVLPLFMSVWWNLYKATIESRGLSRQAFIHDRW